ncbi:MAG: VIT domain-containing protein [Labilithrix sp.]
MHEKTLLYSALGVTALATIFGVLHAKTEAPRTDIAPVPLVDSSSTVATAEVPIKLTASDGTGLRLIALKAEAAVEDPLALTELHLTFENPNDRVLEGTFRITLPQGASLSRFAMKVGNQWQEGEVVEKQAARQAYEDFLHRRQDPALMEQGAGNEFSARVFPIPARGTKEIIITYSENVAIGAPYILPLRGLPQLGSLDVNVHVTGKNAASDGKTDALYGVHQTRFTPASDFVVESKQLPRSPGLRAGNLAIARVIPFATSRPDPVRSAVILVDTSASRGLGIGEQARVLKDMVAKLPGDSEITVACFDQDVVAVYEGKASGFGQKEVSTIVARGALGASNFEGALAWAGTEAKKKKADRVVWVTDGVATAGETDGQKMKAKVEALREAGVTRMDAIAMGGIRDDGFLRTVVRGVLDKDGVVLDAKVGADALARRLGEMTSSGIPVKVEGSKWSYPQQLDGLQAGDEVLVFAEMDGSAPVKVTVGNQPFAPDLRTIERPLVERAWAQAKIQSLIEQPRENAAATKTEIVHLSTSHRVLSPYTALLVLETDWDYRRFNIDRTAKVDILTVEDGKVATTESGRVSGDDARRLALAEGTKGGSDDQRSKNKDKAEKKAVAQEAPAATATAAAPAPMTATTPPADGFGNAAPADAPAPPPPAAAADLDRAPGSALRKGDSERTIDGLGALGGGTGGGGAPQQGQLALGAPASRPVAPEPAASAASPRRGRAHEQEPATDESVADGVLPPARVAGPQGQVRPTTLTVDSGIAQDEVQRVMRGGVPRLRACYQTGLSADPSMHGTVALRVRVDKLGAVTAATATGDGVSPSTRACMEGVVKRMQFPAPGSGDASFTQTFDLVGGGENPIATNNGNPNGNVPKALPYEGRFKTVMEYLSTGAKDAALEEANRWHADQPGDILSLVALGEAFEARNDLDQAARAYGSILELYSFRADSRRFAGERLERLQNAKALALAVDTYGKSVEQRPDHPASHRLYAYTLLKKGEHEKAFEAIKAGATRTYPSGRFRGVDRILKEDMGLIAAAWMKAQPARKAEITQKLHAAGGTDENTPSLRFVLVWETDANDVDFHIHDGKGGHAFYSQKELPSGGELYADVTTGYGPECFTIRNPHARSAYPYTLQAHYYSRGPMGYGMGKMEILEHDGNGGISFQERPFVVMVDRAYVDMGTVDKNTKLTAIRSSGSM